MEISPTDVYHQGSGRSTGWNVTLPRLSMTSQNIDGDLGERVKGSAKNTSFSAQGRKKAKTAKYRTRNRKGTVKKRKEQYLNSQVKKGIKEQSRRKKGRALFVVALNNPSVFQSMLNW